MDKVLFTVVPDPIWTIQRIGKTEKYGGHLLFAFTLLLWVVLGMMFMIGNEFGF
ncbi:hypothetical protein HNR49_002404 [Halobacterium salinarum]|uniref:Uncharacterized protein n=1 Tax=Halobacterium salinarum TaxID=2242 RepID=A0A841HEL7_HALSI|nr:hypothetical protein [Halobacterium salinarum]